MHSLSFRIFLVVLRLIFCTSENSTKDPNEDLNQEDSLKAKSQKRLEIISSKLDPLSFKLCKDPNALLLVIEEVKKQFPDLLISLE